MRFLVIGRLIDAPVAPPEQELALLKAHFEHLASGANPKIKAAEAIAELTGSGSSGSCRRSEAPRRAA